MDTSLIYLCSAFTLAWGCYFGYLVFLHRQTKELKRRIDMRDASANAD